MITIRSDESQRLVFFFGVAAGGESVWVFAETGANQLKVIFRKSVGLSPPMRRNIREKFL